MGMSSGEGSVAIPLRGPRAAGHPDETPVRSS